MSNKAQVFRTVNRLICLLLISAAVWKNFGGRNAHAQVSTRATNDEQLSTSKSVAGTSVEEDFCAIRQVAGVAFPSVRTTDLAFDEADPSGSFAELRDQLAAETGLNIDSATFGTDTLQRDVKLFRRRVSKHVAEHFLTTSCATRFESLMTSLSTKYPDLVLSEIEFDAANPQRAYVELQNALASGVPDVDVSGIDFTSGDIKASVNQFETSLGIAAFPSAGAASSNTSGEDERRHSADATSPVISDAVLPSEVESKSAEPTKTSPGLGFWSFFRWVSFIMLLALFLAFVYKHWAELAAMWSKGNSQTELSRLENRFRSRTTELDGLFPDGGFGGISFDKEHPGTSLKLLKEQLSSLAPAADLSNLVDPSGFSVEKFDSAIAFVIAGRADSGCSPPTPAGPAKEDSVANAGGETSASAMNTAAAVSAGIAAISGVVPGIAMPTTAAGFDSLKASFAAQFPKADLSDVKFNPESPDKAVAELQAKMESSNANIVDGSLNKTPLGIAATISGADTFSDRKAEADRVAGVDTHSLSVEFEAVKATLANSYPRGDISNVEFDPSNERGSIESLLAKLSEVAPDLDIATIDSANSVAALAAIGNLAVQPKGYRSDRPISSPVQGDTTDNLSSLNSTRGSAALLNDAAKEEFDSLKTRLIEAYPEAKLNSIQFESNAPANSLEELRQSLASGYGNLELPVIDVSHKTDAVTSVSLFSEATLPRGVVPAKQLRQVSNDADKHHSDVSENQNYPDNLTKVTGIGPVHESHLYACGVYTWWQISQMSHAELESLSTDVHAGAKVETWAQQALRLAERHNRCNANYDGPPPDRLTVVKGIGDVTEITLFQSGIVTFKQLAGASVPQLQSIFEGKQNHKESEFKSWIRQAERLMIGKK